MFMDVLHVIALCRHSVSALMGCFQRLHKLRSARGLLYMSVSSSSHRSFCCLLKFMAEMYGVQRQVCILESCHARSFQVSACCAAHVHFLQCECD